MPCSDPKNLFALSQEKATLDRLDHPGIIKAYDCFEKEGRYYLVMDSLEGYSQKADKSNPSVLEYDRSDNQNPRCLTVQVAVFPPQAFASNPPYYIYYLRDNSKSKDIKYIGTENLNGTTGYGFTYRKEVTMGWLRKTGANRHVVFVGKDNRTYILTAGSFNESLRDISADFDSFFRSFNMVQ